ncbi:MAG: FG-GAP-like repeat-containing protein [Deltaproteobacteria bacterium]|nr:FG-GAP-like repeat-containing protein [Deltaproteobacteria bacterium]
MRTPRSRALTSTLLSAAAAAALVAAPWSAQADVTCPQTSSPTAWTGSTLSTGTTRSGVVYDGTSASLKLDLAGGQFASTSLGVSDLSVYAASGDFNKDGWDDFVGAGEDYSFVRVYRNHTMDYTDGNLANGEITPDWNNSAFTMPPKFTIGRELVASSSQSRRRPLLAGDFNGDGWPDVIRISAVADSRPNLVTLWLNSAVNDANGDPQFQSGYTPLYSGTTEATFGYQMWSGSVAVVDYNGDRKLDLLVGSAENNGSIRVFLNMCTLVSPLPSPLPASGPLPCAGTLAQQNGGTKAIQFKYSGDLINNLGFGASSGAMPTFAFVDFNGDGFRDLIVGSPNCCSTASSRLRIWKGISGGGLESTSSQSVTFVGALTAVMAADFSLDGKLDIITATDNWNYGFIGPGNQGIGGRADYYVNNGTATPFSSGATKNLTAHNDLTNYDYDVGFVFNYDHDPSNTPDVMIADGNHTANFYVLANRVVTKYVDCGDVASGTIDLGTLASSEMVVTAARIHPTATLNGGTITYYLSNEEPPNWVVAGSCGDASGDLCATFPKPVGRSVRWKATMCSNSTHTASPTLTNITAKFDYTLAQEHYQAGVIISDGVAYVGAFRQPGNRGRFYAVNAALNTNYWDAGAKLDAMSDSARNLYTANPTSTTSLPFTSANASNLLSTLTATDATQASAVVDWIRSARFGVGNAGISPTKLGAIETSTPSLLTKPGRPLWYAYSSVQDRSRIEAFIAAQANRVPLVLVGAKDGMLHAVYSIATAIGDTRNGKEAWGYIPPKIASGMLADYTDSLGGTLSVKSYPDGSPTLVDIKKADNSTATVAIVASGNGGKSVAAIDITQTVSPSTGVVSGPKPLWNVVPGNSLAGQAKAKPAVARVLIGGQEKYVVIAATGLANENASAPWINGRVVSAYDAETGYLYWQFKTACPVTSDITTFETDDALEPNAPSLNGYADRVIFADYCGYLYKVDPAKDLAGGWNGNAGYGTIQVDDISGTKLYALFSTATTTGALGQQSPIAGTLAARTDGSSRMVLFFGTGGLESWPANKANAFYAVYADNGAIRSKLAGTCSGSRCEKFYGGVVVTPDQVILSRSTDPVVGSGTCDLGTAHVDAMALNGGTGTAFNSQFSVAVASAVMGAIYGDRGAIYFATLAGDVARIGTPAAANAGDDTASGYNPGTGSGSGSGSGSGVGTSSAFTLLGWRQVL